MKWPTGPPIVQASCLPTKCTEPKCVSRASTIVFYYSSKRPEPKRAGQMVNCGVVGFSITAAVDPKHMKDTIFRIDPKTLTELLPEPQLSTLVDKIPE